MLDVHDAHHAASTWRDFFVQQAISVLPPDAQTNTH